MLVGIIINAWDKIEKLENLINCLEDASCPHKYFKWLITKQNMKQKRAELRLFCDGSFSFQEKNLLSKFNFEIYVDGHIDDLFESEYEMAESVGSLFSSNHN